MYIYIYIHMCVILYHCIYTNTHSAIGNWAAKNMPLPWTVTHIQGLMGACRSRRSCALTCSTSSCHSCCNGAPTSTEHMIPQMDPNGCYDCFLNSPLISISSLQKMTCQVTVELERPGGGVQLQKQSVENLDAHDVTSNGKLSGV